MVTASTPDFVSQPDQQTATTGADGLSPGTNGSRPDLLDAMADTAHQTIDRLAEQVAPQVQRLQAEMAGATDMLDERADQVRDMTADWLESVRCTVRENPLAAVGAALAVGLLVARLSR
ncbi:DUF883 family protein [Pseudaquabacterium pictum]|uniref:DUF883 domain-containing protein n=1 Tax=Pseudaquabacterium pictum TaxID=2315236 RepID=A0A480B1F5_9BURK|nr:DUF883 family protein [Rubrivivax pictus]GCL64908.1 hypothetical protein AQPW35_39890 [Rubrivivax pictus]